MADEIGSVVNTGTEDSDEDAADDAVATDEADEAEDVDEADGDGEDVFKAKYKAEDAVDIELDEFCEA